GQCLNGCGRDGDCGAGQFCEDDKCVPFGGGGPGPVSCDRNEQCRVGEFCAPEGRCRVGCRPGTCPRAQTCDPQTGRCSGAAAPPDAGPSADAGPDNTFQLTCSLSLQGHGVDGLQVRADGLLQVQLEPDLPAVIVWERVDSPGQTDSVIWGEAADREQPVAFQRVGEYWLRASAQVDGHVEHCELRVSGRAPARGTWIELAWDGDRDLDLHLVPIANQEPCEGDQNCAQNQLRRFECNQNYCSRRFSSRDGRDGDCWARNPNPLWADVNDASSNPHYLGDVARGAGTENITLGTLIAGWNYRLALQAWGEEPNNASLKIFTNGRSVYEGAVLRIAPATPNAWLYLGRLSAAGFVEVHEMSASYPRN
ncbi:MAG: hypothetical protein OSB21_11395, partial [Myxococcota bacterium]|nr:hypothetical protein [Myxococcota bacterium]